MNWLDKKLQKANYKRLDEIRKEVIEEEKIRQQLKHNNGKTQKTVNDSGNKKSS